MKIPEPRCNCKCWNCTVKGHEYCESHTSICNVEWVKILKQLAKEDDNEIR